MKKVLVLVVFTMLMFIPFGISAKEKEINMYLFYGETCPHCSAEEDFLDKYLKKKPNVNLRTYEVWNNRDNQELLLKAEKHVDVKSGGSVPYLIIGDTAILGYSEGSTNYEIERTVKLYETGEYRDYFGEELGIVKKEPKKELSKKKKAEKTFNLPLLGEVSASGVSMPILSVVLGFVDGFNPCALWILVFLITMLMGMKDRKKMWMLGLIFLFTSGLVYLLFMVSWLNLASFLNKIVIIRTLIAIFAVVFGGMNILSFIKTKDEEDGCEVVDNKKRKKIIDGITKIVSQKKIFFAIIGIIILAVSVNMIELMCSLGLPVVFTQILSLNNLSTPESALYIGIYILFYMLDDFVIFFIAMKTLKIKAISNKYTKYSHLIGGAIMLILGVLMIVAPDIVMFNF